MGTEADPLRSPEVTLLVCDFVLSFLDAYKNIITT